MAIQFYEPAKDDKYNRLLGDLYSTNLTLKWQEAKVCKFEDGLYVVYGQLASAEGVEPAWKIKKDKPDWKFEPCLCRIDLHNEDYKDRRKNIKGDWEETIVKPTSIEKFIISMFEENAELWLESAWTGTLHLSDNPGTLNMLITGKDKEGKPYPKEILDTLKTNYIAGEKVEETNFTKDEPITFNFGTKSYAKKETTAEQLKARRDFLIEQLGYEPKTEEDKALIKVAEFFQRTYPKVAEDECQMLLRLLKIVMG
ncbi:MAG: hypothetical protein SAL07_25525 [Oscillatoria sp. PMC 1051.18]|nr:hypothetical protein [Oscillatoria sp. PMC 1050.18]MEC5033269.1 hypothetical protein [Oscillatoria sp. PMC 1051.18]